MKKIFYYEFQAKLIFILAIFLLPQLVFAAVADSPDAIATRVIPNPDRLSPLRWYQANIKNQGSPQAMQVDGYEAVRDGRTVYVNAANIDLNNKYCSNNQTTSCLSDSDCAVGGVCLPKFYTNIYLLSFSQDVEPATEDIFSQLLSHWKFNTNIPPENKDNIIRDTKRLADLSEIKSALDNYQKNHNNDCPSLQAGSYVAGKSLSVWPSWQDTLTKELGITLPLDPVNKLGICPTGYDATTCWDQINKKFFGVPADSRVYIYTYTGARSYNICALMQSGYLTTLAEGACSGSAVGYKVKCDSGIWTPNVNPANVCSTQKIIETNNCGQTRKILYGTKCCDTVWTHTAKLDEVCASDTVIETSNCGRTRKILNGVKTDGECCNPSCPAAGSICSGIIDTRDNGCAGHCSVAGVKTDGECCKSNGCEANTCVGLTCDNGCDETASGVKTDGECCNPSCPAAGSVCSGVIDTRDNGCGGHCSIAGTKTDGGCATIVTQTVSCTAKPANTDWNTSSTVLQTWNGSAWLPSNVSAYDTTPGICRFKCQSGYNWDGSACAGGASGLTIATQSPLPAGTVNVSYNFSLSATGGAGGYTWSEFTSSSCATPPGLTVSSDGVISGIPTSADSYNICVRVNSGGDVRSRSFTLVIAAAAAQLAITASSLHDGEVGVPFLPAITLTATGGSGGYDWSIMSDGACLFPPGLSLTGISSGVATISGTPSAASTYKVCVKVSSGGVSASKSFNMAIINIEADCGITDSRTCVDNYCTGCNSKLIEVKNTTTGQSNENIYCCNGDWWVDTRDRTYDSKCFGTGWFICQ